MKISHKIAAAAFAALSAVTLASSAEARPSNRFAVVDADRGRVVYDDGNGFRDGGCVFRRQFAGYDWYGYPRWRKVYRCF